MFWRIAWAMMFVGVAGAGLHLHQAYESDNAAPTAQVVSTWATMTDDQAVALATAVVAGDQARHIERAKAEEAQQMLEEQMRADGGSFMFSDDVMDVVRQEMIDRGEFRAAGEAKGSDSGARRTAYNHLSSAQVTYGGVTGSTGGGKVFVAPGSSGRTVASSYLSNPRSRIYDTLRDSRNQFHNPLYFRQNDRMQNLFNFHRSQY